jgi:platelet-activating factor acetylhydrolase
MDRFHPRIAWDERAWLWNERLLLACFGNRALGVIALLILGLPFLVLVLVSLPLLAFLPLASRLRPPSGPLRVGMRDAVIAGRRVRFWYPADPASLGQRAQWLPQPALAIAAAYWKTTGLPRFVANVVALPAFLKRAPAAIGSGAAALPPPAGSEGWPVAVFSHGLLGCSSAYSSYCAEIASHGAVVLAIEHADGTAVLTEASGTLIPFLGKRPSEYENDEAWREAQTRQRVLEALRLIDELPKTAALKCPVDLQRLMLIGHSFGGATCLRLSAALATDAGLAAIAPWCTQRPSISALVLLDPWIEGCGDDVYDPAVMGSARQPTLIAMTQSMMFPTNAERIAKALAALAPAEPAAPFAYVELRRTRHQEASDFPTLMYPQCRLMCMAGGLPPRVALQRICDTSVGFLAASGAQQQHGWPSQARAAELVRGWLSTGKESDDEPDYLVHAASEGVQHPNQQPWKAPRAARRRPRSQRRTSKSPARTR